MPKVIINQYKHIVFYVFAAALAIFVYTALDQNIEITLKPHVTAMNWMYQMQFEFLPGLGYREIGGMLIIGRDCLGGRLFVCLFSVLIICRLGHFTGVLNKTLVISGFCALSLVLSYIITFVRIAASLPFCEMPNFKLIHNILSLMIYFGSIILLYEVLSGKRNRGAGPRCNT